MTINNKTTRAELIKELREALQSEKEYKEMLHREREENDQLKKQLEIANWRGEQTRNFFMALACQTATMNKLFGVPRDPKSEPR